MEPQPTVPPGRWDSVVMLLPGFTMFFFPIDLIFKKIWVQRCKDSANSPWPPAPLRSHSPCQGMCVTAETPTLVCHHQLASRLYVDVTSCHINVLLCSGVQPGPSLCVELSCPPPRPHSGLGPYLPPPWVFVTWGVSECPGQVSRPGTGLSAVPS